MFWVFMVFSFSIFFIPKKIDKKVHITSTIPIKQYLASKFRYIYFQYTVQTIHQRTKSKILFQTQLKHVNKLNIITWLRSPHHRFAILVAFLKLSHNATVENGGK